MSAVFKDSDQDAKPGVKPVSVMDRLKPLTDSVKRLATIFGKPASNFEEMGDDFATPRQSDASGELPFDRFAKFLPYTAFDEINRLFMIESDKPGKIEGWGFVLEIGP